MTEQMTVPKQTWDATVKALERIYNWSCCVYYGTDTTLELNESKKQAKAALTAANAVSEQPKVIQVLGLNVVLDPTMAPNEMKLMQPQAQGGTDPDDSLLICASDLEHSAIYDNHREMQSCIRAVAQRIKSLAAHPQATEPQAQEKA